MPGNSTGKIFRLTTFGESHGKAIGGILDGCPSGMEIDLEFIQQELSRRKPGSGIASTPRKEPDQIEFLSGIFEGKTLGTPIAFVIWNKDQVSKDYNHLKDVYRPSHADFTYEEKYGIRDYRGGGRSSARETVARVAAGAIAKILLRRYGVEISAFVSQIGPVKMENEFGYYSSELIEKSQLRCPDEEAGENMIRHLDKLKQEGDTTGGVITCIIRNCPAGIGEPVFDKLEADLAKAMLSINAVKGFELGSGFKAAEMKGSEHNDRFVEKDGKISTITNFSGGIQGGISNGQEIYLKVAFKPVATLMSEQKSVDSKGNKVSIPGKGRHDVCVVPRAVPIVEAMAALVTADHILRQKTTRI
jgi:chorismate synthase